MHGTSSHSWADIRTIIWGMLDLFDPEPFLTTDSPTDSTASCYC